MTKTTITPTGRRLVQIDGLKPMIYLFTGTELSISARWIQTKLNYRAPVKYQWLLQAHNFCFYPAQDDEFHRRIKFQQGYSHGTHPNQWMLLESTTEAVTLMMKHGFIEDSTPPEIITEADSVEVSA